MKKTPYPALQSTGKDFLSASIPYSPNSSAFQAGVDQSASKYNDAQHNGLHNGPCKREQKKRGALEMRTCVARTTRLLIPLMFTVVAILLLSSFPSYAVEGGHATLSTWPANTWYIAEGFTGGSFDTYILLANLHPTMNSYVRITYMKQDGTSLTRYYWVDSRSRNTIHVDEIPELSNTAFSATIAVDDGANIVAERAMYFDYNGRRGGHSSIASRWLAPGWSFAEGFTGGDFDTYILLSNPHATEDATVQVTYYKQDGTTVSQTVYVPHRSRHTIHVDEVPGMSNAQFSTYVVEYDDHPSIVAERAMYFDYNGKVGGHATMGLPAPASVDRMYLAEGYTGPGFDTYIVFMNPWPHQETVNLTLIKDDGTTTMVSFDIDPRSRYTIHVDELPGFSDASFGAKIETEVSGILAERAMYFDYYGLEGGHVTLATPADRTAPFGTTHNWMGATWYIGEGYSGGGFDTWLLLFNPSSTGDAEVTLTFVKPDGSETEIGRASL